MAEQQPKKRKIDELAEKRAKQLAAEKKARDDEEAKARSAEQKTGDKTGESSTEGMKKVLKQNNAGGTRQTKAPGVSEPSRRSGGVRAVTLDRIEERDNRKFHRDREEWNRQARVQRLSELDREWRRGPSGSANSEPIWTGRHVQGPGPRRDRSQSKSPYAAELDDLLSGGEGKSSKSGAADWMPQDTSKDAKQRFGTADFFGRENRGRSSRYAGGYLSAEFRENFINSRMEGLNPGDAGYDVMRRKAEGAWGQAVKQYDRQFQQFGQEKLKEQSRLDFQQKRETLMKQQEEARQKQAEEQKQADGKRQKLMESRGVKGYDPDAKPQGSALTNRELEQSAAEAVRRSAMQTGVEARIVIGSGANAIAASGGTNGRSTTWVTKNDANAQQFLSSKHGLEMYGGRGTVVDRTAGARRGLQVGDSVGGTEMNTARREQDAEVARMARTDEAWKQAQTMDAGGFELVTGMKREESRTSSGGRYAGAGTIVFGDQKTFDTAVAQNQKRRRGVA